MIGDFKNGVALCQSIPGATAIQMAAYVGLKSGGVTGALASYVGFGLPAFILMLIFSVLYARYNSLPEIISLFGGLQVIVVAIILNAIYAFGKSNVKNIKSAVIALLSASLFWWGISPFMVVVGAGLAGVILFQKAHSVRILSNRTKEHALGSQEDHFSRADSAGRARRTLCRECRPFHSRGHHAQDRFFRLRRRVRFPAPDAS